MLRAGLLRTALAANATFSSASGALLTLAPGTLGTFLGFPHDAILRGIGVALLAYAGVLAFLAFRSRAPMLLSACAGVADFGWVGATISVAAIAPGLFSEVGWWAVGGVALVVAVFGMAQAVGIVQAFRHPDPLRAGWSRVCVVVNTDAPARVLWPVIREAGAIHRYAPFLATSRIVEEMSERGLPVRECRDHGGTCWREEIVTDDESMILNLRFLTERPDFPFPVRQMVGGWQVMERGNGAHVRVWWDVVPKSRFLAFLLLPVLLESARRSFPAVVANMQDATGEHRNAPNPGTRRIGRFAGVC